MTNKSSFNYSSVFKILSKGRVSLVVCGMLATSGAWAAPYYTAPVDISLKTGALNAANIASSGTATYSVQSGSGGTISQTTPNAIINWNKFNIANGEGLNFIGGNATLNRISGGASTVAGHVAGDHALFFVNPNGITISGTMVAPTLVLSTYDIADSDFNAGTYKFTRGTSTAAITNSGTIGDGGLTGNIGVAALFAANVENYGDIESNNIAIVAANAVTLGATATGFVAEASSYDKTASGYNGVSGITASTVATSITNTGYIHAASNGNVDAGNIDIHSTKGTITNTDGIESWAYDGAGTGNGGVVTLKASGDIINTNYIESGATNDSGNGGSIIIESTAGSVINNNGTIENYSRVGNSGTVSVTATNGMIDNGEGNIYSESDNGASDTITLHAKGDIGNLYGRIYSYASGASSNSGAVSLTSDTGSLNNYNSRIYSQSNNGASGAVTVSVAKNIDNSNGGSIYSQSYSNSAHNSGTVSLSADTGAIDLSKGGQVSSQSDNGTAGDITISAPHLLFTSDAIATVNNWSRSYISGNNITVTTDTINGLDAKHLDTGDTTIFDTYTWTNTPSLIQFSNVAKGMILGTPATLPTGGTVASGTATIDDTSVVNQMTVTQTTANAIINWSDFSVAFGNTVNFTGGNATLNRVTSTKPSVIAGSVTGDHALFFVNPNGIIATGTMTAPTLVLSTLAISDTNFNQGAYSFTGGNSGASIVNYGTLGDGGIASGFNNAGVVALFAPNITNSGQITSHSVALVAANTVTLGVTATGFVNGASSYDQTASVYSGVSGIGVTTTATSIVNNNANITAQVYGTIDAGRIDIYSKNGDIQNHGGTIKADGQNYGSSDITVHASGDIQSYRGNIYATSSGTHNSGSVSVISDNGNIDSSSGYIYSSANGNATAGAVTVTAGGAITELGEVYNYGDISGNITVTAVGNITQNDSVYSEAANGSSGNVSITSTAGGIFSTNDIYSYSQNEHSGTVKLDAYGDITSKSNIYSQSDGGTSVGDVSAVSHNGSITFYGRNIYSQADGNGNAGAVSVQAHGDVNILDDYYVYSYARNGNAGAVTVTSDTGAVNNHGQIYSQSDNGVASDVTVLAKTGINSNTISGDEGKIYSQGAIKSGNVLVKTTSGSIDLTNGGQIYSTNYSNGIVSDVTIYAPEVTYTTNEQAVANNSYASYIVSEGSADNGTSFTHGNININANTINGVAVASATLVSTADTTKNWESNGNDYNFFGTVTKTALPVQEQSQNTTQAKVEKAAQAAQIAVASATHIDIKTASLPMASARANGDSGVSSTANSFASASPAPIEAPSTRETAKESSSSSSSETGKTSSNDSGASQSTAPIATGSIGFMVGHDITGGGNAMAYSTIIPGVFVVAAQ